MSEDKVVGKIEKAAEPALFCKMKEELDVRFAYHAPKEGQPAKYEELRMYGKDLAGLILKHCPVSREQALALGRVEEAIFWANAAIARREQ